MTLDWTVPRIDGLRAAFYTADDGLVPVDGQGDVEKLAARAALTRAVWQSVQALPEAAMMLIKSDAGASIGLLNGGLLIEGTSKINLGLVRAATKSLAVRPDPSDPENQHTPDANRLRRTTWQILERLHGAQIPRVFHFDFAGTTGQVRSESGALRFGGGFEVPAAFAAALTTACDGEGAVSYTLEDLHDDFPAQSYSASDLLLKILGEAGADDFEFDPDGWPLSCREGVDFGTIQTLSGIAVAACAMSDANGDLTLTALSDANRPLLIGKTTADRSMVLTLS